MLWGTTETFLDHFGLKTLDDLPGLDELKASGLLDPNPGLAVYAATAGEDSSGEPAVEPLDADEPTSDVSEIVAEEIREPSAQTDSDSEGADAPDGEDEMAEIGHEPETDPENGFDEDAEGVPGPARVRN